MTAEAESSERFQAAKLRIDAVNAQDPVLETVEGSEMPRDLVYGRRMSARLRCYHQDASEALQLAVRAQHVGRWQIARDTYPPTRTGYLQWRSALSRHHADLAAEILIDVGYDAATVQRIRTLLRKHGLGRDAEVQVLEDVACLVFLEHYFPSFARRHEEPKLIGILQKTWAKMSARARDAALELDYPDAERALLHRALSLKVHRPSSDSSASDEASPPADDFSPSGASRPGS